MWSTVHWCCTRLDIDHSNCSNIHNTFSNMADHENLPNKLISSVFGLSAGSVLLHLLDWVRLHKADVDEKAKEVLQSESPAEHGDYWDVVSSSTQYVLHKSVSSLSYDVNFLILCFGFGLCRLLVTSCRAGWKRPDRCWWSRRSYIPQPGTCTSWWTVCSAGCHSTMYDFQLLFVHFCCR